MRRPFLGALQRNAIARNGRRRNERRRNAWRRTLVLLVAAWLCLVALTPTAHACPFCRAGLADDAAGGDLVSGYFWSILFMLGMPPLIFGGLSLMFYLQVRNARAAAVLAQARSEEIAKEEDREVLIEA